MSEARAYARQIAYLRCPYKVQRHTKRDYGVELSLAVCAAIVDAHTLPERRFREQMARRQHIA